MICRRDGCWHDAHCPKCGHGYFFEVGLGSLVCEACGQSMDQPSQIPIHMLDDDVLLDPRYVTFDSVKAFRIIRDLGRLGEC